jgi:hypothetical protein
MLALLVTAALVVTACARQAADEAGPAALTVAALTDHLAAAGVAVYDEPGGEPLVLPADPVSPVRLLTDQVRAMHVEVRQGGGVSAAELDEAVEGAELGGAPVSASSLIAGWAGSVETPAARWAQELLTAASTFSDLVLLLFLADVATVGASLDPAGKPNAAGPLAADATAPDVELVSVVLAQQAPAAADAPCSTVVGFINESVRRTFEAVKNLLTPPPVKTGWGLFDTLANGLINVVVGAAQLTVRGVEILVDGVVRATIAEVMAIVARIASVVGTLAQIKKLVEPWTVQMTADPPRTAVGGPAGAVTAAVQIGFDTWPSWMVDCATVAGKTLPELKPAGARVAGWSLFTAPAGLAQRLSADERLSAGAEATLAYRPVDGERRGDPRHGVIDVTIGIERDDVEQLRQMFLDLVQHGIRSLTQGVPGVAELIRQATQPLVNQVFEEVRGALAGLRMATGSVQIPITYYDEPDEDDPGATPDQPGGQPTGCPYGTWQWPGGPMQGRYTWTIQPDGVMLATYHNMQFGIIMVDGSMRTRFTDEGGGRVSVSDVDASGVDARYVPGTATGDTPAEMYQELSQLLYGWNSYACTASGELSIVIISPIELDWAELSAGERIAATLTPTTP